MSALVQTVVNPKQLYTPFIGRTEELGEITRLLSDSACRLLTLVGPGGIGKTRLGMETAQRLETHYADGAYFVPLQALNAPEQIIPAIAEEVCLEFYQGSNLKGQLLDYLEDKSLLLVLDNLEHLLDGVEIIGEMLAAAPGLKILATARERLNLQEEWFYPVGGMRLPPEDALDSSIENFSAIHLFVQHARRANPAFSLDTERPGVTQICQVVGGMPLGIELAAAWVRVLSCAEIAEEIQRGLDILETPSRNMPERHRNMRAVVEQSWKRLSDDDRCVLMWLSIFRGGFTRDAAKVVTGTTIRDLSGLVDKSWLRRDSNGRYDLHELLRQYAEEQLAVSGEAEDAHNKHSQYFADLMHRCEGDIKFQRQTAAIEEIEHDFTNVRTAWYWAAKRRNYLVIDQMVEAMSLFCDMTARFIDGENLFTDASHHFAESNDPHHRLTYYRLRTRRARLMLLGTLHDVASTKPLLNELKAITDSIAAYDDPAETAFSLYIMGVGTNLSDVYPGLQYFEQSFVIYSKLNDLFYMAELLVWIALSYKEGKNSRDFLTQALELQRQIGDQNGLGWTLSHFAHFAFYEHQYAESNAFMQEAFAIQRERGDLKGLYWSLMLSSVWALNLGEFEQARRLAEEGLGISRKLNQPRVQKTALAVLGCLLILTETDYAEGRRLCLQSRDLYVSPYFTPGNPIMIANLGLTICAIHDHNLELAYEEYGKLAAHLTETEQHDDQAAYALSALGPMAALILASEGQVELAIELVALSSSLSYQPNQPPMIWLEKWPMMIRSLSTWEAQLGASRYAAAWERGARLDVDTVVDLLTTDLRQIETFSPQRAASERASDLLTERELEIMQLIAEGNTNQQIAERLVFAVGTVKWYVSQIFSKLHVANRTQAIARARELKLLA